MKNELCVLVGLGCLWAYHYSHPGASLASAPETAAPVAEAAPAGPKLHYHSPLDAPAMRAESYTGMGYYSTDESGFDVRRAAVNAANPSVSLGGYQLNTVTGERTATGSSYGSSSHLTVQSAQTALRHVAPPASTPTPRTTLGVARSPGQMTTN